MAPLLKSASVRRIQSLYGLAPVIVTAVRLTTRMNRIVYGCTDALDAWERRKMLGGCACRALRLTLQCAWGLRCRVLGAGTARCFESALQGASTLRCKVLGGFAVECWQLTLQGASRLRCRVLRLTL